MNKSKFLCCVILLFGVYNVSYGQKLKSSKITPSWIKTTPKAVSSSQQFIVVMDSGASLTNIENNKYINLENYLEKEIQTNGTIRTIVSQSSNDSFLDFETSIKGGKHYKHKQIDEYWEMVSPNEYSHYYLYSISTTNENRYNEAITTTTAYGARGLWRSAIVPGWGQFYKGSKAKGGIIFGGTVALVIGSLTAENMRANYMTKTGQTYDVTVIKDYATKADNMANVRNFCIGGAVALYVYNLIDAIVAPGARRVVVKSKFAKDLSFNPIVGQDYGGAAVAYKF